MKHSNPIVPVWAFVLATALVAGLCTAGAASVTYGGRAVADRIVFVNPSPNVLVFADTGDLPPQGGSLSATEASVQVGTGILSSRTLAASTSGGGGETNSAASQEDVVAFAGQPAQLTAAVVRSQAHADCSGATGSSIVTNLTLGGVAVTVTGAPNQTVSIPAVATLVINEQVLGSNAIEITVNALHLYLGTGEEVVLSSSRAGVECALGTQPETWGGVKALYQEATP
jgi:hypothetical protein